MPAVLLLWQYRRPILIGVGIVVLLVVVSIFGSMAMMPPQSRVVCADPIDSSGSIIVGSSSYPGDDAPKDAIAQWMGAQAQAAGYPAELPVMAAIVESGVTNHQGDSSDGGGSRGFFQMRRSVYEAQYHKFWTKPTEQMRWFLDQAKSLDGGAPPATASAKSYGDFVARIERPLESLRYKYAETFEQAKALLAGYGTGAYGDKSWRKRVRTPGSANGSTPISAPAQSGAPTGSGTAGVSRTPLLAYGVKPTPGRWYTAKATTFDWTSIGDDNGIGFFGPSTRELKYAFAELGWSSGMKRGKSLGGLPGGTYIEVAYQGRSVTGVVADVGAGAPGAHIDLHSNVALALGLPSPSAFNDKIQMRLLASPPARLSSTSTALTVPGIGPGSGSVSSVAPQSDTTGACGVAEVEQGATITYPYPLQGGPYRITASPFGKGDGHSTKPGSWKTANAVDIAAPQGTPILSPVAGVVRSIAGSKPKASGRPSGGFNVLISSAGNDFYFAGLGEVSVTVGSQLVVGGVIGGVGPNGLHLAMHSSMDLGEAFSLRLQDGYEAGGWDATIAGPPDQTALDGSPLASPLNAPGASGATPTGNAIVDAALKWLGTPYSWSGGSINGPTLGTQCGPAGCVSLTTVGFDCSGLTMYAYWQGAGIALGHYTKDQWAAGTHIPPAQARAGDLIFFKADLGHVGIWMGGNKYVEAPRTGDVVKVTTLTRTDVAGFVRINGGRPA